MISSVFYFEHDDRVIFHSNNVKEIRKNFLPGFYKFTYGAEGINCDKFELNEIHTPYKNEVNDEIIKNIMLFFSSKKLKKQINMMGFPHKMGVLLYGKPGTGKTTLLNYISNLLFLQQDAIVLICDSDDSLQATLNILKSIREIQKNPIVVVMDEFERFVSNSSQEARLKTFLDGTDSVDNCLVLGATNYVEQVPESIGKRESRIRILKEIKGITSRDEISEIVNNMLDKAEVPESFNREKLIDSIQEDITVDQIKNHVITSLMGKKIKSDTGRAQIGFLARAAEDEGDEGEQITLYEFLTGAIPDEQDNTYRKIGKSSIID